MPTKPRIGNWQEELVYEADKKKLLAETRALGGTLSQQIVAKVQQHRKTATLASAQADGFLRFGVPVMLQNAETECFLSTDTDDKSSAPGGFKIACTTAPAKNPMVRNTWILLPVPSADDDFWASKGEGDVVHYGQKFLISSLEQLADTPLYLSSELKSPNTLSKITKNQEVYFSAAGGQQAMWTAQFGHLEYRPDMEGQPVKANCVLVLKHVLTNMPLASTKAKYGNDFGMEWEVCANKFQIMNTKHGNAPEQKANLWAFVTAPAQAEADSQN